jgi:hypothetical protein
MDIQTEYENCMAEIDKLVICGPDMDGSRMTVYCDGYDKVLSRMNMLEDIMSLKKPVDLDYCEGGSQCTWTADDYRQYEAYLTQSEDEPSNPDWMGIHHGRNE